MAAVLALALASAVLRLAAGQSVVQCPVNTGVNSLASTWGQPNGNTTIQAQVVQWCRLSEAGPHTNVAGVPTRGTRAWGSNVPPDGSNINNPSIVQVASGYPNATTTTTFNATCRPTGTPQPGDIDGRGGQTYFPASPACAIGDSGFFSPTQCPVSALAV